MKKNLKRVITLVLACALALSFAACGEKKEEQKAPAINSPADLKDKKIGVQTGTTGDLFVSDDKELGNVKIERFSKGSEAVQSLSQGKIDAVVIDNEPAKAFLKAVKGCILFSLLAAKV